MTIAQELTSLNATKTAIATAIEGKGGNLTGIPFSGYADVINLLSTGGGGSTGPSVEWSEAYYQSVLNSVEPYQRPKDWLTLPNMVDGDSKLIGLCAVYPNGNYVALSATGNYTVNWGDGTVENFASNIQAEHAYNYAAAALDGTNAPVGLAMDGTVTRANHGRVEGEKIKLYTIVGVTELKEGQECYVRDVTQNSFKLSATVGGVALTFASAGTAALLPYKQAIIQLTPQAGQTLTSLNLQKKHTALSSNTGIISINFLDLKLGGPAITSLLIGSSSTTSSGQVVNFSLLEQIAVYQTAITDAGYLFYNSLALKNVSYLNSASFTNMNYMFNNCRALQAVPLFNTAAVTNMNYMFGYCYALQTVPLFNTASVTNMSYMFGYCYALQTVPLFNTAAVTIMNYMFNTCYALQSIPLFNTASVTSMGSMFNNCRALRTVPLFNTAAVTNMSYMLSNCFTLQTVPLFNTAAVTNMSYMFSSCFTLQTVPLFDAAKVTTMSSMFGSCGALKTVPALNAVAVTDMSGMFTGCCALSSIKMTNIKQTFSIANCSLDAAALNEIYTNLPTVTGNTITVTGNQGVTGDNPAIATAKGWTVTG